MDNPKRNQRIRVRDGSAGYDPDKIYTIGRVDPGDHTLIAVDESGNEGLWVKWRHCELAGDTVGWPWLKGQLSVEALELLNAFSGVESLGLRGEIRDHILLQLPDLKQRLIAAQIARENTRPDRERGGSGWKGRTRRKSPAGR